MGSFTFASAISIMQNVSKRTVPIDTKGHAR